MNINFNFNEFKKKRILVIGDIMLDEYYLGDVNRINPEAPVPIVNFKKYYYTLGGSSNVAHNIRTLSGNVHLLGIIGNDEAGKKLINKMKLLKINVDGIIISNNRPTTVKTRIIGNNQIIVRIDNETTKYINENEVSHFIDIISNNVTKFDCIILSDYLKGVLHPSLVKKVIDIANKNDILCIADTKSKNLDHFKGVNIIIPNKLEAENATNLKIIDRKSLFEVGNVLINKLQAKAAIIKLGKQGISLITNDGIFETFSEVSQHVIDVSGAGDTVLATLALSLSSKIDIINSVKLANIAAQIVVEKMGTATVSIKELENQIIENKYLHLNKIKDLNELTNIINEMKKNGKIIVFTNGCFDILHVGHIRYFYESKKLGDILVVGLNSDSSVRALKGEKRPIIPENERAEMLAAIEYIDYIVIFSDLNPSKIIERIKPHIQTKGNSYTIDQIPEAKVLKKYGGKIILLEETKNKSTTKIVEKIINNYTK